MKWSKYYKATVLNLANVLHPHFLQEVYVTLYISKWQVVRIMSRVILGSFQENIPIINLRY